MNQHTALQELGLSQMRVINRFFDLKVEVLFALLRHRDIYSIAPVQRSFAAIGRILDSLMTQITVHPNESAAEQTLRLRGCNALRRMARDAVQQTHKAVMGLLHALDRDSYTAEEWTALQETVDSLAVILDSNLYLLDNSLPEEAV